MIDLYQHRRLQIDRIIIELRKQHDSLSNLEWKEPQYHSNLVIQQWHFFTNAYNQGLFTASARDGVITLSPNVFDFLTLNEIKACIYHEVGHIFDYLLNKIYMYKELRFYIIENSADHWAFKLGANMDDLCRAIIKSQLLTGTPLDAEDGMHLAIPQRCKNLGVDFNRVKLEAEKSLEKFDNIALPEMAY